MLWLAPPKQGKGSFLLPLPFSPANLCLSLLIRTVAHCAMMSHLYESIRNASTAEFTPVAVNNDFHLFSTVQILVWFKFVSVHMVPYKFKVKKRQVLLLVQWSLQHHSGTEAGKLDMVPCPPWRRGLHLLGAELEHPPLKHCETYLALDTSNSQQSTSACVEALA